MPRDVINTVLDRVIDQNDLVDRALAESGPAAQRLKVAMRRLFLDRSVPVEQRRDLWRRAFVLMVLSEAAGHLPATVRLARESLRKEMSAVRAAGGAKVRTIPALRKPDIMRRQAERKEGLGAEADGGAARGA